MNSNTNICESKPQRRFPFSDNEHDGQGAKESGDKSKDEEVQKSLKNPDSSKKAPQGSKTETIADDPFYPTFMLEFDKKTQREIGTDIANIEKVSQDNDNGNLLYLSLSENQGVVASEANLVTSEDNAEAMISSNLQESSTNSGTTDQLSRMREDDNDKESIVAEEERQRGEEAAKKSDRDDFGLTGVKVELVENCEAEQIQVHDKPITELAKTVASKNLTYMKNIWQSEMEVGYHQTMQNLRLSESNWVIFLQKQGDSSKEAATSDHSNKLSLELKYAADGSTEKNASGKENIAHKDARKITDAPKTAKKNRNFPIHVEGTKTKSQPILLGALEEENDHLGVEKQMLRDKSSSSEDAITDNSDSAQNGKCQYSMWSRFKKFLTDRLGHSCKSPPSNKQLAIGGATCLVLTALVYKIVQNN
ncbi:hypothetical protein QYM36_005964 [Artemia franciscana]|uniref:Uncharacterized protein n=1 Tax=Artemia franciscana TaxID=6661 RepID=A0AA88L4U5_ARTSF|nr:hypothetical protein QYM36_005964 [Artemia franciscana]